MADLLYDHGLDEWRDWTTSTFTWLALKSTYTPTPAHRYITDIATQEITTTGYSRAPVTTPVRTVDTTAHRITYGCDDPDFGSPDAGDTVSYIVLAKIVTDDTDSVLLSLYDIANIVTDGGPLSPVVGADGVHYIDQA